MSTDCDLNSGEFDPNSGEFSFCNMFVRYSKFEKLRRAMVWLVRFRSYMKWKYLHSAQSPACGFISVEELKNATIQIGWFRMNPWLWK